MIAKVIVWTNGMVMVFDERGQQMPDYQGQWIEERAKIERDKPPHVAIQYGDWARDIVVRQS